jgi:hypothetical protein
MVMLALLALLFLLLGLNVTVTQLQLCASQDFTFRATIVSTVQSLIAIGKHVPILLQLFPALTTHILAVIIATLAPILTATASTASPTSLFPLAFLVILSII